MAKKLKDSELGGGAGLIQKQNIEQNHLSGVEQTWSVYATDIDDPAADVDPSRVGKPASYLSTAPVVGSVPSQTFRRVAGKQRKRSGGK